VTKEYPCGSSLDARVDPRFTGFPTSFARFVGVGLALDHRGLEFPDPVALQNISVRGSINLHCKAAVRENISLVPWPVKRRCA